MIDLVSRVSVSYLVYQQCDDDFVLVVLVVESWELKKKTLQWFIQSYFYLIFNFLEENFEQDYLKMDFLDFFCRHQNRACRMFPFLNGQS